MRAGWKIGMVAVLTLLLGGHAHAVAYEDRSGVQRAGYTAVAVVYNVIPITAAVRWPSTPVAIAPRCLPGYLLCKFSFAAVSVIAAGEQLVMSGGSDLAQTRAILHRGFAGDWLITGRHVAEDREADVFPDPGPARSGPGESPPR